MYRDPTLTKLLTYAGALPFWALGLAQVLGYQPGLAAQAFIGYGTGIACFMAGTLWSQAQIRAQDPRIMLIGSNVAALLAIGGLLVFPLAPVITMALVHEQERSGAAWTLEWMILPQMAIAAGASTRLAIDLLQSVEEMGDR